MPIPFIMPKMDMDQESVLIVEWLKKEGERVEKGEPVVSVETDKITSDIEAPESGILAGILYHENQEAPVTKVVAYILQEGESLPAGLAGGGKAAEVAAPVVEEKATAKSTVKATPLAAKIADGMNLDLASVPASGAKVTKADVLVAHEKQTAQAEAPRPAATPAARKLGHEQGLDLATVSGSGPRGRVQVADVQAALNHTPTSEAAAKTAQKPVAGGERMSQSVPMLGKRKRIAERLTESYQSTPHIYLTVEVDMSKAETCRTHLNAHAEKLGRAKISMTALLTKMVALTLKKHPYLNASLIDEHIELWEDVNIGIATAVDNGLLVPVVHGADGLGVAAINEQMRYLTQQARANALTREEVDGGTFTISNLGMFGIHSFTAIINPPQSAILAVGGIVRKPVVVDDQDTVAVRPMMMMTLSVDHRIVDGAVGAAFLADLVGLLETPVLVLFD